MAVTDQLWQYHHIRSFERGVDRELPADQLPQGVVWRADNFRVEGSKLKSAYGYTTYSDATVGSPQLVYTWQDNAGNVKTILITTTSVFQRGADDAGNVIWVYVAGPQGATTVNGTEASGQTVITVVDGTGLDAGNIIAITLDDGTEHRSTVASRSSNDVTIDDALPSAATNTTVLEPPALNGATSNPVSAITWAADDLMVFTNGIDPVFQLSDTTCIPVVDITTGGFVVLTAAQWITTKRNQIFLFGTTEGGTTFPTRIRRSVVASIADWDDTTAGTTAGFEDIHESLGKGIRVEPLGDSLALYFREGIGMYDYVGQSGLLWKYRIPVRGQGLLSPAAVAAVQKFHAIVTDDDIYTFNGTALLPLGRNTLGDRTAVKDVFLGINGDLNPEKKDLVFMHYSEPTGDLKITYPSGSAAFPDKQWNFNLKSNGWTNKKFDQNTFLGMAAVDLGAGNSWSTVGGTWAGASYSWNSIRSQTSAPLELYYGHGTTAAEKQVFQDNFTESQDNGTNFTWILETGDYRTPAMDKMRVDLVDLVASGGTIALNYSTDEGITYKSVGSVSPGGTMTSSRLHRQFVGQQVRFKMTGTDQVTIEGLGFRFRPESLE